MKQLQARFNIYTWNGYLFITAHLYRYLSCASLYPSFSLIHLFIKQSYPARDNWRTEILSRALQRKYCFSSRRIAWSWKRAISRSIYENPPVLSRPSWYLLPTDYLATNRDDSRKVYTFEGKYDAASLPWPDARYLSYSSLPLSLSSSFLSLKYFRFSIDILRYISTYIYNIPT